MKPVVHLVQAAGLMLLLSFTAAGQSGPPHNILENGDFSQGFACYAMGTYMQNWQFFLLDHDLPPGNTSGFAGEVACPLHSNCTQGTIAPAPIPVDANETYEVTGYYKCGPNGTAKFQIVTHYDNGSDVYLPAKPFTCDATWRPVEQTFGPFSGASIPVSMELVFYNNSSTTYAPLAVGDVKLTWLVNGQPYVPPQHTDYPFARPVSVVLGSSSIPIPYVKVDGSPYFALGFFNVPPSATQQ